ncbi:MAG: ATP-dependent DNA helicase [bacterium]
MSNALLDNLNPEQLQAVEHTDGPLLIIAGAGTGKTTVITKKIAYLIEQGLAKPDEILALTFTDKAAGEMEERVDRLLPYGYLDLWISTFHAFCEKILRERGIEIGLPDFKLLSTAEQWMLMRKNLDKFKLDYYRPMGNPTKFLHALLQHFSRAKDEVVSPEDYLNHAKNLKLDGDTPPSGSPLIKGGELRGDDEKKKITEVADAYHIYNQLLLEEGALDFGDLINYALKLFKTRPQILKEYQSKFKYILVDEFQDTNFAQYELVKLLAGEKRNLTVVGDDDQSIYRFRGASMSNILIFSDDFPSAEKIVLVKNYRSGQKILDSAYNFISLNNPNRLEIKLGGNLSKKLISQAKNIGEVELIEEAGLDEEVAQIMKKILELKNEQTSWNDFAILVRANDSAKPFIHQAELLGIPYQFLASRGLYSKPVVSWLISFIKLMDNYRESSAMYCILSMPLWGITSYQIADLSYHAKKKAISLYEACEHAAAYVKDEAFIKKIKSIVALLDKLRELVKSKKASQIVYRFLQDSNLLAHLTALPDSAEKKNNFVYLNKFYKKIKDFEKNNEGAGLKDFLNLLELELEAGEAGALPADPDEGPEMVKILTVHSAKGLEFKYVFIVNLVDKRFPSTERRELIELPKKLVKEIVPEGDIHLEEERRLFYVAMTRAKEKLFLTWGKDYGGARLKKPSRFLYEMGLVKSQERKNTKTLKQEGEIAVQETIQNTEQFKYSIPNHFSYSQIKAFESCPYQYKLRFVLNIPTEGGYQASFGRSVHNALFHFFLKIKGLQNKTQAGLFGENNQAVFPELKVLQELYNEHWIGDWYESQEDMKDKKEKGWHALKNYYEELKNNPPNPLYLEQEFTMKFDNDSFTGVIDRIDALSEKKAAIIDYKTGSPPKEGKLTFDDKEQLLIYYLACRDILGILPEKLALYYIMPEKLFEFAATEEDLRKVQEKITRTIADIKRFNFKATPEEHTCRFCDFNSICEFKK